jgi:glycosidase
MFDSRDSVFRSPVGAVAAGTSVSFKIVLPCGLHCSAARLAVTNDATGAEQCVEMCRCGTYGSRHELWECNYAPAREGLYFYCFYADTWRGTLPVKRGFGSGGEVNGGKQWQLTVYGNAFMTPGWLAGGVIYQIFPDRFCRSGEKKHGVPLDRIMHSSWGGQPGWEPDEHGEVTNNDYFGGDLRGIEQKLGYLKSLGVTCIYLNPIFESHSNHRYDAADYMKIDPLLGTEEDFRRLCRSAAKMGMRVMLDGVFNHTGSDSIYFNRKGRYPLKGAYQSKDSPYYPWYMFKKWPDEYSCWWNFENLPAADKGNPSYRDFINGSDGVVRKWLRAGASGWRLDVADELPDDFLEELRAAAKAEKPDAAIIGEVWEDASNKIAYGKRKRYFWGKELDSVMNYPFRNAILGYLTGESAPDKMEEILSILENYPPQTVRCLMNNIGTHDTERAITALAGEPVGSHDKCWQSETHLTQEQRTEGLLKMRLASLMQFTLPGVPCIYYGDEAGMEGYKDPFNRGCYPWGNENAGLLEWYRKLGRMRAECDCLREGTFIPVKADGDIMAYIRHGTKDALLCAFNRGNAEVELHIGGQWNNAESVAGPSAEEGNLVLPALSCAALLLHR